MLNMTEAPTVQLTACPQRPKYIAKLDSQKRFCMYDLIASMRILTSFSHTLGVMRALNAAILNIPLIDVIKPFSSYSESTAADRADQ